MNGKIELDRERFKRIIRGKVRKDLKAHIIRSTMPGLQGKKVVSIPVPQIDLPRFKYGSPEGGVGQGEGEEGDILGPSQDEAGGGEVGDEEGKHVIEVEFTIDELTDMLAETLELPRMEPKGRKNIIEEVHKYTGISRTGPESLRHNKRTFKEALKRQISSGEYDPDDPMIIPVREDKRYRSRKTYQLPMANAVIIYMMDVSGSMGEEQKDIVRTETFWIDQWVRKNYDGLEARFIIHDAVAKEVPRYDFFRTKESGGTIISSAYNLCNKLIDTDYPSNEWNIYAFHFSDGDNWGNDDSLKCVELLEGELLEKLTMFGYVQVKSPYGSGEFLQYMNALGSEKVITSKVSSKHGIFKSIKDLFGKKQ